MCRVKRGGDEAGVDGSGYQLFESSYGGQIERGEQVFVGQGCVRA